MTIKTLKSLFTILFIFTIISIPADSASLPAGISIHRLDNGMEVLLIRNPGLPMTGANMVVKVGSAYETFATSGMSHMLEHLLFNGTTSRTQKELYNDTDSIGGYNNANTSDYFTNYMMVTPSENFEKGLEIQADMLFNSILPNEKFKKEKGIVLEEISKSLAEPAEQLERNMISVVFKGHALSLPTLGTYSTIESMIRDEVYAFYKNNYVPNNMILSVVGDFEINKMLGLINRVYGGQAANNVSRPEIREWSTGFNIPLKGSEISGTFNRFYSGKETVLQKFFRINRKLGPGHIKILNVTLKREAKKISGLFKKKFPEIVREVKLNLHATPVKNFVEVKTTLKKADKLDHIAGEIIAFMDSIDLSMSEASIKSEVLKARTNYLKNIEKPHMFGIFNAYYFAVNGIEPVLSSYMGSGFHSISEDLGNLKVSSSQVTLIQNPSPENDKDKVEAKTTTRLYNDSEKGKSLIVTNNGGSNLLAIHYLFKHKAMYESQFGNDAAKILHQCFGIRLKSEKNIKKTSPFGLTFKVNDNPFFPMDDIYLHPDFGYIRIEGLADDVASVLSFLNSELSNFKPTEVEFKKAVAEMSMMHSPMMMRGNVAKKIFDKEYFAEVFAKSKYAPGKKKVSFENLLKFSEKYFNPKNMIVSVSSPEKTETIDKLFNNFFTEKNNNEPDAWAPEFRIREKPIKIEKSGKSKRSYLFWGFTKNTDPEDKAALQALSLYLSDTIVFDIREKRGMAYRMSAGIKLTGDKAVFFINMGTRPGNVDKIVPVFPEFFKAKDINKLTDSELKRLVNMYLGRMKFRRLSSINRAYYLAHSLYFNNDINYDSNFFSELKNIKVEDIRKVAKKYMVVENPVSIIIR